MTNEKFPEFAGIPIDGKKGSPCAGFLEDRFGEAVVEEYLRSEDYKHLPEEYKKRLGEYTSIGKIAEATAEVYTGINKILNPAGYRTIGMKEAGMIIKNSTFDLTGKVIALGLILYKEEGIKFDSRLMQPTSFFDEISFPAYLDFHNLELYYNEYNKPRFKVKNPQSLVQQINLQMGWFKPGDINDITGFPEKIIPDTEREKYKKEISQRRHVWIGYTPPSNLKAILGLSTIILGHCDYVLNIRGIAASKECNYSDGPALEFERFSELGDIMIIEDKSVIGDSCKPIRLEAYTPKEISEALKRCNISGLESVILPKLKELELEAKKRVVFPTK